MSRIVVKIGSNVLARKDGKPNITNMSALVDQIAYLKSKGHEVVLVSSGAVACGRSALTPKKELDAVSARQLYSAIGQIKLINLYDRFFDTYGLVVGQVLTQKDNFSSRTAYLNQRACMLTMLQNGVIPIVNENDTVSLTELMFTDNDELSGLIATMIDADLLVILSNVDGIYTGNPSDPESRLIERIAASENIDRFIVEGKSSYGRGGMTTKCNIAGKVSSEGIAVVIACGNRPNVLVDIIEKPSAVPHTLFEPSARELSSVKRWIAHSGSFAKGGIRVNENISRLLSNDNAVSILPVGVTDVEGEWEPGDIIIIKDNEGKRLGIGKAAIGSAETSESMGNKGARFIIHYDYLYIE